MSAAAKPWPPRGAAVFSHDEYALLKQFSDPACAHFVRDERERKARAAAGKLLAAHGIAVTALSAIAEGGADPAKFARDALSEIQP
jgi:hypothetical protein